MQEKLEKYSPASKQIKVFGKALFFKSSTSSFMQSH
jgi:hypothetical protein